jgi:hypothetical protein
MMMMVSIIHYFGWELKKRNRLRSERNIVGYSYLVGGGNAFLGDLSIYSDCRDNWAYYNFIIFICILCVKLWSINWLLLILNLFRLSLLWDSGIIWHSLFYFERTHVSVEHCCCCSWSSWFALFFLVIRWVDKGIGSFIKSFLLEIVFEMMLDHDGSRVKRHMKLRIRKLDWLSIWILVKSL